MKEGYVVSKSAVSAEELEKINAFTRHEMSEEELYTFSIILCDNDIDRDFEKFSVDSLYKMAELFIGKTGIFDHNMSADNQSARIYDCYVEKDESKRCADGEIYHKLIGKAYMPKTAKNADLITEIESGIKKEVSVGCSVSDITCSICKEDMRIHRCEHIKGKEYNVKGKPQIAYAILDNVSDVYEWSFVAVPAQRNAGVIKNFSKSIDIKKYSDAKSSVTDEDIDRLVDAYTKKCSQLEDCRLELKREINLILNEKSPEIIKAFGVASDNMSASELIELKNALSEKNIEKAVKTQLGTTAEKSKNKQKPKNQGFII